MTITDNGDRIILTYPATPTLNKSFPKANTKIRNYGDHVFFDFNGVETDIDWRDVTLPVVTSGSDLFNVVNAYLSTGVGELDIIWDSDTTPNLEDIYTPNGLATNTTARTLILKGTAAHIINNKGSIYVGLKYLTFSNPVFNVLQTINIASGATGDGVPSIDGVVNLVQNNAGEAFCTLSDATNSLNIGVGSVVTLTAGSLYLINSNKSLSINNNGTITGVVGVGSLCYLGHANASLTISNFEGSYIDLGLIAGGLGLGSVTNYITTGIVLINDTTPLPNFSGTYTRTLISLSRLVHAHDRYNVFGGGVGSETNMADIYEWAMNRLIRWVYAYEPNFSQFYVSKEISSLTNSELYRVDLNCSNAVVYFNMNLLGSQYTKLQLLQLYGKSGVNIRITNNCDSDALFNSIEGVYLTNYATSAVLGGIVKPNKGLLFNIHQDSKIKNDATASVPLIYTPSGQTLAYTFILDTPTSILENASAAATRANFIGQVAGMTTDIQIQANVAGAGGNVSLIGDGAKTIAVLISDWNIANPGNQLSLIDGDSTQIPNNLATIVLSGGAAQAYIVDNSATAVPGTTKIYLTNGATLIGEICCNKTPLEIYYDDTATFDLQANLLTTYIRMSKNQPSGQGADLVSANDIIIDGRYRYFKVTGNVQINTLSNIFIEKGIDIILEFDSNPVVKHNQAAVAPYVPILLDGSADYNTAAGGVLVLYNRGDAWKEKSRVVM